MGKAKTDKLNAEVIARVAQAAQPQAMVDAQSQQLSDLVRRRQQLPSFLQQFWIKQTTRDFVITKSLVVLVWVQRVVIC